MSRVSLVCGLLVLGGALAIGQADQKVAAPLPAPPAPTAKEENPALSALRTVIPELPEVQIDPKTTLASVLNSLSERFHKEFKLEFRFSIKVGGFEADGIKEPDEINVVFDRSLPAMRNVSLDRYLRVTLER